MSDIHDQIQEAEHIFSDNTGLNVTACLQDADELKVQGNDFFRAGRWDEALAAYRSGLGQLPKRVKGVRSTTAHDDERSSSVEAGESETEEDKKVEDTTEDDNIPETESEKEFAKARAILNANIGACYVKLGDHKQAVDACSQALLDDPQYVKALQRRAVSNENINSWTSLTAAQEDYKALLKLFPSSSALYKEAERSLQSLKPRIEAAQKQETSEMLEKLKGLGNSLLGNFGLSTDNFKFEPNGQGGYSVNFSR